ncbi:MAG: flagella basal body P-ring formation protein FlgA [Sphingomonas sp.]
MLLFLALAATTPPFQSTATLDTIVAQFTGKAIGEEGGAITPVDPRLKLAACAAPQLAWHGDLRDAVVVRCMTPEWRIFVPVRALPQPKTASAAAPLRAAPAVKAEPVIRRGDSVTIEAGSAGISVTREGVAMNDAAPGARLSVKIDDARAPLQAIAIAPGHARLPGWGD